eukprot:4607918-Amphidinium_carterae.2
MAQTASAASAPPMAGAPGLQALAEVASAARVLSAYGFSLTHVAIRAQKEAEAQQTVEQPPAQWAGYRPQQAQQEEQWSAATRQREYHSWKRSRQSWQGMASPAHTTTGTPRKTKGPTTIENVGGKGSHATGFTSPVTKARARKDQEAPVELVKTAGHARKDRRYTASDLFVDSRPGELRIWGHDEKVAALGRPGAAALAVGNARKASKSLRDTGRVFIKLMQVAGRLPKDKTAYGYKPTWRQLGRIRAFMDYGVDFSNHVDDIWGDSDRDVEEQPGQPASASQPAATQDSGEPNPNPTPAEFFVSKRPSTVAVRALFEQAGPPPKEETEEEGFHDPRDEADQEFGEPAPATAEVEMQLSMHDELLQRASDADTGRSWEELNTAAPPELEKPTGGASEMRRQLATVQTGRESFERLYLLHLPPHPC